MHVNLFLVGLNPSDVRQGNRHLRVVLLYQSANQSRIHIESRMNPSVPPGRRPMAANKPHLQDPHRWMSGLDKLERSSLLMGIGIHMNPSGPWVCFGRVMVHRRSTSKEADHWIHAAGRVPDHRRVRCTGRRGTRRMGVVLDPGRQRMHRTALADVQTPEWWWDSANGAWSWWVEGRGVSVLSQNMGGMISEPGRLRWSVGYGSGGAVQSRPISQLAAWGVIG